MSQCVPNWELDETPLQARFSLRSNTSSPPPDAPALDYEVAELTWENGQLAMHALGPPRLPIKPQQGADATWPDKPRGNGTLESIVNQATVAYPGHKQQQRIDNLVPWFDHSVASATTTMAIDALVPSRHNIAAPNQGQRTTVLPTRLINDSSVPAGNIGGTCNNMVGCSTRVASCRGGGAYQDEEVLVERKRARVARVPEEWSERAHSVSGSVATAGRDMTLTSEREAMPFTSTTCMGSSENTSSDLPCTKATTADDHDSVGHSRSLKDAGDEEDRVKRSGKSSVSTKRSRAAAIHNQSERKRRDKINQRMKTLQKLVPNSNKTDKASMLDEVIDYLKQLQAQVQMMNRMNMQTSTAAAMMLPMALQQQQLQMSMMAPMMGLGMGMGMPGVMDLNALAAARSNIPGMPNLHGGGATTAAPFMPMAAATWDGSGGDRGLHAVASTAGLMMDPMAAFLSHQSQKYYLTSVKGNKWMNMVQQPMTLDAYSRMAAMYQQMVQQPPPPASSSKN